MSKTPPSPPAERGFQSDYRPTAPPHLDPVNVRIEPANATYLMHLTGTLNTTIGLQTTLSFSWRKNLSRSPEQAKKRCDSAVSSSEKKFQPNRSAAQFVFSICLIVYFFSAKGTLEIPDSFYSVETAQAIVTRGQLDIPYAPGYTLQGPGGRSYSKYGIGLPLCYLPAVAATEALVRGPGGPSTLLIEFLVSFANIPFVILALVVFARILRQFSVPETFAMFCLLGLGLGTLAWRYACYGFSEGMQMGLLTLVVYALIRRTSRIIIAGGIAFAWLFLIKQLYVAYLPILLVYLVTRPAELRERIRKTTLFIFPVVLAGAFDLWLNFIRFGNVFESGYGSEAGEFYPLQIWRTIPMLLGSPYKGLLIFCPILVLGLLGWKAFARQHRAEAVLCSALIVENLIIIGAWHDWEGGWCWGPRFLVPFIPLWLLPAAFLHEWWQSRKLRWTMAILVLISVVTQIPGVLVADREIRFIKDGYLTPAERTHAPSDYAAAWILLRHKLIFGDEIYRTSEFHAGGDRKLDLSKDPLFSGINTWTEHLGRALKGSGMRWYPLFGLLMICYLAVELRRTLKAGP
jgi:hypothetical protein